jgi:cell division protein FtsX
MLAFLLGVLTGISALYGVVVFFYAFRAIAEAHLSDRLQALGYVATGFAALWTLIVHVLLSAVVLGMVLAVDAVRHLKRLGKPSAVR